MRGSALSIQTYKVAQIITMGKMCANSREDGGFAMFAVCYAKINAQQEIAYTEGFYAIFD